MNMRICPQCGKAISTAAEVCPFCGIGDARSKPHRTGKWAAVCVLALLVVLMMVLFYRAGTRVRPPADSVPPAPASRPLRKPFSPMTPSSKAEPRPLPIPAAPELVPDLDEGSGAGFQPVELTDPSGHFAISINRTLVGKEAVRKSVVLAQQRELAASADKEIVYFEVSVKNVGKEVAGASYLAFSLDDSGGYSYPSEKSVDYLYNKEIRPGATARGGLLFPIYNGNYPTVLKFRTGFQDGSGQELVASAGQLEKLEEFSSMVASATGVHRLVTPFDPASSGGRADPGSNATPAPESGLGHLDLSGYAPADYRKLLQIYHADLFGYYGLGASYDTDLKKSAYQETAEYRQQARELEKLRETLLSGRYYLKIDGGFARYDAGHGGVALTVESDAGYDCTVGCGPLNSSRGFIFDSLPLYKDCDLVPGVCEAKLVVPMSETLGRKVENHEAAFAVYLLFKLTGTRRLEFNITTLRSGESKRVARELFETGEVRVVAVNPESSEIYFDHSY